jgi:hypothetical protein
MFHNGQQDHGGDQNFQSNDFNLFVIYFFVTFCFELEILQVVINVFLQKNPVHLTGYHSICLNSEFSDFASINNETYKMLFRGYGVMVFNTTFNKISAVLWQSV